MTSVFLSLHLVKISEVNFKKKKKVICKFLCRNSFWKLCIILLLLWGFFFLVGKNEKLS